MKLKYKEAVFDSDGNVISSIESLNIDFHKKNREWIYKYQKIIEGLDEKYYEVDTYEDMMKLTQEKKNILRKSVLYIISSLEELRSIPLLIWLNGSYARNSCVYGSDIDINFCYPNEYYSIMIAVEEYISIVLCEIFGLKYRDLVHPMGYSRLENNYLIEDNFERKLYLSESVCLPYIIRKSGLGIMKEFFELSRDVEDINRHFIFGFNNDPAQEWIYTRDVIYSNNYEFNMSKIDTCKTVYDINLILGNIKLELEELANRITKPIEISVAVVKNDYRNIPLKLFYQYTIFESLTQSDNLVCDISVSKISSCLKKSYIKYRKQLMCYEKSLIDSGIEWSMHNYKDYIDITDLEFIKIQKETRSFINDLIMEIEKNVR